MEQIKTTRDRGQAHGVVMNFASILEDNTREQVEMTSTMPFIFPHIALMPDAHLGKGCAVGAVLPTRGAIMPAAVGVDIGCGMMAVQTQFSLGDLPAREHYAVLREAIEHAVPLGMGRNGHVWADHTQARIDRLADLAVDTGVGPSRYDKRWEYGLGSLGSGNHFIEVSLDEEDRVWLFLHSGSRGVGNKIAQHHIDAAQRYCARNFVDLPHADLAYLVEGTEAFEQYIADLNWAQAFARENRAEMMDRVAHAFENWLTTGQPGSYADVKREQEVNCHHNYTERENHWGENVWLSRKGAIRAREGDMGLIPGSMGTRSYVVRGKGDRLALDSAPHGAGRAYGRKHAERTFTLDDLRSQMGDVEYRVSKDFIDEIPSAYKDIDVVMADAADLVEVVHTLRQIINVKGA